MTFELFMALLAVLSVLTSLCTEAIKTFLDSMEIEYASNIIVLAVAVFVGIIGTSVFYAWNDIAFTSLNIISIFLMVCANWLCAMLGYDKIMQAIAQMAQK